MLLLPKKLMGIDLSVPCWFPILLVSDGELHLAYYFENKAHTCYRRKEARGIDKYEVFGYVNIDFLGNYNKSQRYIISMQLA